MTCDTSHGWVKPRADGAQAKCGGPDICPTCQTEKMHDSMLTACFGPCSNSSPEHSHAAAAAVARDAARYRWLRDHACNSLNLTRDGDHACNYLSAAEWIDSCPEDFQDDAPEEVERMKAANTIWRLQVYPNTPIGFWALHGSTLDAVVDAALSASQQGGE